MENFTLNTSNNNPLETKITYNMDIIHEWIRQTPSEELDDMIETTIVRCKVKKSRHTQAYRLIDTFIDVLMDRKT